MTILPTLVVENKYLRDTGLALCTEYSVLCVWTSTSYTRIDMRQGL